jgi:hypothetical protein
MGPQVILCQHHTAGLPPSSSQQSPLPPSSPSHLTQAGENLGFLLFPEHPRAPGLTLTLSGLKECQSWASQPSYKGLPLWNRDIGVPNFSPGRTPHFCSHIWLPMTFNNWWHSQETLHMQHL